MLKVLGVIHQPCIPSELRLRTSQLAPALLCPGSADDAEGRGITKTWYVVWDSLFSHESRPPSTPPHLSSA
jgi:hypothetical protein